MKSLLILFVIISCSFINPDGEFIDPTGTYILKGDVEKNKIVSRSGEMRVKLINPHKLVMCFYLTNGYPDYESLSFVDTLLYDDNHFARYKPSQNSDCTVLFFFSNKNAEIQQLYSDPKSGCSFGNGVLISTIFKKLSKERPVIQDLSARGITQ